MRRAGAAIVIVLLAVLAAGGVALSFDPAFAIGLALALLVLAMD